MDAHTVTLERVNPLEIGGRLRTARRHARLTTRALAERGILSKNVIGNYENGLTERMDVMAIARWADECGVSVQWVIDGTGPMEVAPPPSQPVGLHRTRHDATVEAAIRYSLSNGGEPVELSDNEGLTLIENGEVIARIRVTSGADQPHTHQYCHLRRVTGPRPHLTKAHFDLAA